MKKVLAVLVLSLCVVMPVSAISEKQENAIVKNCDAIREDLKNVQRADSKVRVYLGKYYEIVLRDFITPLDVRLVENNLSNANLVENQNKMADAKTLFANDFVSYQQELEELIVVDCALEPETFYEKLNKVRQKRKVMEQDTLKIRSLISVHLKLANGLKEKL